MIQSRGPQIDSNDQSAGRDNFPSMLTGRRRLLFARLVGNGVAQAAVALALPFAILESAQLPVLGAMSLLVALAGFLIGLRILELVDAESLGLDYVAQVRLALFDGLAAGTAETSHGVAMSRLMNDLAALKNWIGLGIARSCVALLSFTGCVAAAATLSVPHALAILAPALVVALCALLSAAALTQRVADVRQARGRLAALLGESLLSLGMLKAYGQLARNRKRVRRLSRTLNRLQARRMHIAATLRALPEAILPFAVIFAIAAQLPLKADSIGFLLLVGLAIGPARQALRALEYRATFLVARERLATGLGRRGKPMSPATCKAGDRTPGLEILRGPIDQAWSMIAASATPVTADTPLLRRSLRRNIDISGRLRGDDETLQQIAGFCGLLDEKRFPDGLDTRLSPGRSNFTEWQCARISLARALAFGAKELAINAPVLLVDAGGRALIRRLPERFDVRVSLIAGDIDLGPEDPKIGVGGPSERSPGDWHQADRRICTAYPVSEERLHQGVKSQ